MKSLDYKKIAKRLKARRTALGMTYQELADKASMSKSTTLRERSERIVGKKSVLLRLYDSRIAIFERFAEVQKSLFYKAFRHFF